MKTGYKLACLLLIFLFFVAGAFSANVHISAGQGTYDVCRSQCFSSGWPQYIQSSCIYSPFTYCEPITAANLSNIRVNGHKLCAFYNGAEEGSYIASNCQIYAENVPPYPYIETINCDQLGWLLGGWPGGGSQYYNADCTECNANWTDTSTCGECTPNCDQSCTGTKTQTDNCGNTRTVNCTIPATGCTAPLTCNPATHACEAPGCTWGNWSTCTGCTPSCDQPCTGTQSRTDNCGHTETQNCTVPATGCPSGQTCTNHTCQGGGSGTCNSSCTKYGERDCASSSQWMVCVYRDPGNSPDLIWKCYACSSWTRCKDGSCVGCKIDTASPININQGQSATIDLSVLGLGTITGVTPNPATPSCSITSSAGSSATIQCGTYNTTGTFPTTITMTGSKTTKTCGTITINVAGSSCTDEPGCSAANAEDTKCSADLSGIETCTQGGDGCYNWINNPCPSETICSGATTTCISSSEPNCAITTQNPINVKTGRSATMNLSYANLDNPNSLAYTPLTPTCQFTSGPSGGNAIITCGTYDTAGSYATTITLDATSCGTRTINANNCTDECPAEGQACNGNIVESCAMGSDGCYNSTTTDCSAIGQVCWNGSCIASGSPVCSITTTGPVSIRQGGSASINLGYSNFNPSNLDYNPSTPICSFTSGPGGGSAAITCGTFTSNQTKAISLDTTACGSIGINVCNDDCAIGATRCSDLTHTQECGNSDASDICYEWGPPIACAEGQCFGGNCQIPVSPVIIQSVEVKNPVYKGSDLEITKIVILNSGNARTVFVDAKLKNTEAIPSNYSEKSNQVSIAIANGTTIREDSENLPRISSSQLADLPVGSYYLTVTAYDDSGGTTKLSEKVLVIGIADNPRPLDVPETNGIGAIAVVLVVLGIVFIAKRKSE